MAAWNEAPAAGGLGECAALVRSAEALRFSAPELAVQLARRALTVGADAAEDADVDTATALSMRAQAVLAAGLVRISHHADAVEPAFAALALADGAGAGDVAAAVRLDLAACSREVGEPLLGCALLRPVLDVTELSPLVRAVALGRLVGCVAHVGRRDDIEDLLTEADRLLARDEDLSPDLRRLERARLSVRAAAYHRWYGDTEDATEAAREGLTQLNRLRGLRPERARLRAQLVLELVCALLDEGALEEAASVSEAVLAEPVRATSAAAVGRLMLAVSTRVHLPSGRVERGRGLLDQAVWVASRHGLDGLLADTLTAVSQLDEKAERPVEALESLRDARAAEQRRLRAMAQAARHLLTETSPVDWDVQAVNSLLRSVLSTADHQPAQDWHQAAQRVAQSARQRTQPDESSHPADPPTRPNEQPAPRTDAAGHSGTASNRPRRRASERTAATPWTERAAAAHAGEPSTPWAEQFVAERSREQAAAAQDERREARGARPAAAQTGEPTVRHGDQNAASRTAETHAASREESPTAQSSEHAVVAQTGKRRAVERPDAQEPTAGELVSAAADRVHESTDRDEATGLLNKDGLIRRLRSVRNGERPVALALVRLDGEIGVGRFADPGIRPGAAADFELSELAGRVRNIAPQDAELARSDGTELAVLLPHTTRDQAEQFAAAIESAWLGTANGHNISTGVVQSNPEAPTVDARALINAARHALTPAVTAPSRPLRSGGAKTFEELEEIEDNGDTLRIGRAIISSLSIPTGSGGKRRAADSPEGERLPESAPAPTDSPTSRNTPNADTRPTSETPPSTPTASDWPTTEPAQTAPQATDNEKTNPRGWPRIEGSTESDPATDLGSPATESDAAAPQRWSATESGVGSDAAAGPARSKDGGSAAGPVAAGQDRSAVDSGVGIGAAEGQERSKIEGGSGGDVAGGRRRSDAAGDADGDAAGGDRWSTADGDRGGRVAAGQGWSAIESGVGSEVVGQGRSNVEGGLGGDVAGGRRRSDATGDANADDDMAGGQRWSKADSELGGQVAAGQGRSAVESGVAGEVAGGPEQSTVEGGAGREVVAGEPSDARGDVAGDGPAGLGWSAIERQAGRDLAAGKERSTEGDVGGEVATGHRRAKTEGDVGGEVAAGQQSLEATSGDGGVGSRWSEAEGGAGREVVTDRGAVEAAGAGRRRARDGDAEPGSGASGASRVLPPAGYSSSTYEQTKAELALLMSALATGNVAAAAPLPAPSRPVEDEPRNGVHLSVPTPPEPDEVPEPKPRPDIPDPGEPDPIPPAPPEPGPPPPDEPGPLVPPSVEDAATSDTAGRDEGGSGLGDPSSGDSAVDLPSTGRRSVDRRRDTSFGAEPSQAKGLPVRRPGGSRLADAFRGGAYPETAEQPADVDPQTRPGSGTHSPADGDTPGRAEVSSEPQGLVAEPGPAGSNESLTERGEGRRERSSTTIAGLLAEALAAYQETTDDSEPAPKPAERARDDDFDRLFDWRYQSPASGRHRSPE